MVGAYPIGCNARLTDDALRPTAAFPDLMREVNTVGLFEARGCPLHLNSPPLSLSQNAENVQFLTNAVDDKHKSKKKLVEGDKSKLACLLYVVLISTVMCSKAVACQLDFRLH